MATQFIVCPRRVCERHSVKLTLPPSGVPEKMEEDCVLFWILGPAEKCAILADLGALIRSKPVQISHAVNPLPQVFLGALASRDVIRAVDYFAAHFWRASASSAG